VSPMSPQARIEALRGAPSNGWVAFSEDEERIIAYGATYDEVVASAEKNGVSELVVVKIPENWDDRVL
jgi:predicted RNase H-like HicB family nuclease